MSDLIDELMVESGFGTTLGDLVECGKFGFKKYEIDITSEISSKIGKDIGHYVTMNCDRTFLFLQEVQDYLIEKLALSLKKFLWNKLDNVLVVGLGNGGMVADSLGVECGKRLLITKSIQGHINRRINNLCFLEPKVCGVTGINSFDIVYGVTSVLKPSLVILIDTLCANDINRLACSFQLSNSSLMPGGGVGNTTTKLNKYSLGVEIVVIGVPFIISGDRLSSKSEIKQYHFTIKEIDYYIKSCANIIAKAINLVVYGKDYDKYLI